MNLSPFAELFKNSWELYKKKINVLAIILALPFVANAVMVLIGDTNKHGNTAASGLGSSFSGVNPTTFVGVGAAALIAAVIVTLVTLWVQTATIYAIDSTDAKPDAADLLKKALPLVMPVLLVAILVGLAVVGGLILLIIPGIIFAVWFGFSNLALVLDNQRGTSALKASKALVQGRWWAIFGRMILLALSLAAISIVVGLVFGALPDKASQIVTAAVSSFLLTPLATIFGYLLYKDAKSKGVAKPAAA